MKILREDAMPKETLPVSFLTDLISKGWEEVGVLKESSLAIKETYRDTQKIESLIQDLMDAYLVFIGQIELYLDKEKNIVAEGETVEDEPVDEPKPMLPEAELDIEPIPEEPSIDSEEAQPEESRISTRDFDNFSAPVAVPAPEKEPIEPFEFFVDFDEPDMSEPRLSDNDLYGQDNSYNSKIRN